MHENGKESVSDKMDYTPPPPSPSNSCFLRIIQKHYTISVKEKSEAEIKNEKWLFPNSVLFNRWFCLPAAFIIQFCCGSLYAWSVYNKPVDQLIYGTNANIAPITFYIAIGFYGIAAALAGPWLERHGPKQTCLLGAFLFFFGNIVTALALYYRLMWLVFLGYGGLCGSGLGICYITPVSALQKWFPDKRGFGAGFATCGFGAGSIVIAKVQLPLIHSVGLPLTFVILGTICLILMTTSALVLRTPPPNFTPGKIIISQLEKSPMPSISSLEMDRSRPPVDEENNMTLIEALSSIDFRIIMLMFIGDIAFGLVLASRLSNIVIDIFGKTPEEAATVVSVNGGVNFIGRLFFSIISDYVGRKNCFIVLLTTQVIVLGFFSTMTNAGAFVEFWVSNSFVTAAYGAAFGVIPAFLTDKFGPANIGACHGIMILGWAVSGVIGGLTFTLIFNSLISAGYKPTDPFVYNVNAWWLLGLACIGWLAVHFVPPTKQDLRCNDSIKRLFWCNHSSYSP